MKNFLSYYTPKIVVIQNWKLTILRLLLQLLVFGYVIWSLLYEKSYQKSEIGNGIVNFKVKGNAYDPSTAEGNFLEENSNLIIWDNTDVVVPAKETEAIFVTTNYIKTPNQKRSICVGSDVII